MLSIRETVRGSGGCDRLENRLLSPAIRWSQNGRRSYRDQGVGTPSNSGNIQGDCFGHGTAVAGIFHAMAPAAEIGSFRVLGVDFGTRSETVRLAASEAIKRGYHVLIVSMGCGRISQMLKYKDWVDRAYLRGVHVVSACNNQNYRRVERPGHFTSVNSVNFAKHAGDNHRSFQEDSLVEFACGGVAVHVAWLRHGMKVQTGSSFAAPPGGWNARANPLRVSRSGRA